MTEEEKKFIPEIILSDLKYLSIRKLYFDWFFSPGAEIAIQLLDGIIKIFLRSTGRTDLVREIIKWGRGESHNVVRIIEMLLEKEIIQGFLIVKHRGTLLNLLKLYRLRYLDSLPNIGATKTMMDDLNTIDYTYFYFRNRINVSTDARKETLIDKVFSAGNDLLWGEDKISLAKILYWRNLHFKP